MRPLTFLYKFRLKDGESKEFEVRLDSDTLAPLAPGRKEFPDWTRLGNDKCPNCPFSATERPNCPAAVNLIEVFEFFRDFFSYEKVDVEIVTAERTYAKHGALEEGLSSLVGLHMVVGGCPILGRFKPMVRTHLPFSGWVDTLYRVTTMYLLGQYFRRKKGQEPDWDLRKMDIFYKEIHLVNKSFSNRLRSFCEADANLNALIKLDCLGTMTPSAMGKKKLEELAADFDRHLD